MKALNRALLESYYDVKNWDVPEGYLCPPIPGRADYIHQVADLLDQKPGARILDIGTGASLIYPIIGRSEYSWSFVGTDIDPVALDSCQQILAANPKIAAGIELRHQPSPAQILKGVILPGERFDAVLCNPPFHCSLAEAQEGSRRKWRNLGHSPDAKNSRIKAAPVLNFGGQASELWCAGGEVAFVSALAQESAQFAAQVNWFTALVSKEASLPKILGAIAKAGACEESTIPMEQGQKISRLVAWRFSSSSP